MIEYNAKQLIFLRSLYFQMSNEVTKEDLTFFAVFHLKSRIPLKRLFFFFE